MKKVEQEAQYHFRDGAFYVGDVKVDFEAMLNCAVEAGKKVVPEFQNLSTKARLSESLANSSQIAAPGSSAFKQHIHDVDLVRAGLLKLADDLYLRAQMGLVRLTMQDSLELLGKEYKFPVVKCSYKQEGHASPTSSSFVENGKPGSLCERRMLITFFGPSALKPSDMQEAMGKAAKKLSMELAGIENILSASFTADLALNTADDTASLRLVVRREGFMPEHYDQNYSLSSIMPLLEENFLKVVETGKQRVRKVEEKKILKTPPSFLLSK